MGMKLSTAIPLYLAFFKEYRGHLHTAFCLRVDTKFLFDLFKQNFISFSISKFEWTKKKIVPSNINVKLNEIRCNYLAESIIYKHDHYKEEYVLPSAYIGHYISAF